MHNPDAELRELLAQADPSVPGGSMGSEVFDRLLAAIDGHPAPQPRPWLRRHWQGSLTAVAAVASLALAIPVLAPSLFEPAATDADSVAIAPLAPGAATDAAGEASAPQPGSDTRPQTDPAPTATAAGPLLVRSASLLVGAGDIGAAAEEFTTTVATLGGRVLSESIITQDGGTATGQEPLAVSSVESIGLPYPWYPAGPGVYLTVEVPADRFEEAVAAARSAGEVVQLQQSSFEVGTQVADVDARIAALETSLRTLTGLLDQATSVSDVIALEAAITQRQAELDGLRAQQRDLAAQTSMSQISLALMSPDDARDAVDPQPQRTWWESFLDGLADLWGWLGKALLVTSPLLLAGAVIWGARRRGSD